MGALEAINKLSGFFNRDDEDLLEIIATFTGGIVKNSLLFEDSVLKLQRSKKLMHVRGCVSLWVVGHAAVPVLDDWGSDGVFGEPDLLDDEGAEV